MPVSGDGGYEESKGSRNVEVDVNVATMEEVESTIEVLGVFA